MNNAVNGFFARVALSFARKIDTDLIAFVRKVIAMMTNNTQYPSPSPDLATITTSVNSSVQTAATASGPWEAEDLSTSPRVVIGGLTPGEVIWARACANGSAGASEWTAPTTAMAI